MTTSRAEFSCAVCGAVAATLTLLEPGQSWTVPAVDAPPGVESIMAGSLRVEVRGTAQDCVLSVFTNEQAWRDAISSADAAAVRALDNDVASFWCPTCSASYCRQHWVTSVVWDEAGPDYMMGACAGGHARMVVRDL